MVTQRFCTSDCDQLEPPLPPLAQVGPTLVNGVAQRPPVPAIQKTTAGQNNAGKAAQRTSAAPVGTEVVFLASRYRIRGIDHDGSEYDGTVTVRPEGGRYRIRWSIGSEIYNGVGMLAGDRLSIDGNSDDDQFRYDLRLLSDGSLTGTWTSGGDERGSEEWSPS